VHGDREEAAGVKRFFLALLAIIHGFRRRRERLEAREEAEREAEPIVPPGPPAPRAAELAVVLLLLVAAAFAVGFIVVYAVGGLGNRTQLQGITLGGAFAFLAAALITAGKHLVVEEEVEEAYHDPEHPDSQRAVEQIVHESGSRITRKKLLITAGGAAGAAVGLAAITPALTLGPLLDTDELRNTPWRRGLRLIGDDGKPMFADQVEEETFYTAFPEHANRDLIGAPVVVVRLPPAQVKLPPERAQWAPMGIVAFSKICTHAGCAIALYRKPTFAPTQPRPALVCPCHYSTFDPARGGEVIFGPAGRPLPQLPLVVGGDGILRAGGNFSGQVGPAYSTVRSRGAT
jgi:ubiquinol-cytochrome c reductase iron-sulfur subunit